MAEVKLIYCGSPRWSANVSSLLISYVYANDRGDEAEIVVWNGEPHNGEVWLYPAGVERAGKAVEPGYECAGLLSAQAEAIGILSHE